MRIFQGNKNSWLPEARSLRKAPQKPVATAKKKKKKKRRTARESHTNGGQKIHANPRLSTSRRQGYRSTRASRSNETQHKRTARGGTERRRKDDIEEKCVLKLPSKPFGPPKQGFRKRGERCGSKLPVRAGIFQQIAYKRKNVKDTKRGGGEVQFFWKR